MQNRQHAYLLHILASAELIHEYGAGYTLDQFLTNPRSQGAVLRRLLLIGEAAAQLCTSPSYAPNGRSGLGAPRGAG